jgi:hypothetical protein
MTALLVLGLPLTGCGNSSTTRTSHATAPPSNAASATYVRSSLVPAYEQQLHKRGAEQFGTVSVKCAATGGSQTECAIRIPYKRLEDCAVAEGSVFIEGSTAGTPHQASNGGSLKLIKQICYIAPGASGGIESVPSPPSHAKVEAERERSLSKIRREGAEAKQRGREELAKMQREEQERQQTLQRQGEEARQQIEAAKQRLKEAE